MHSSLPLLALVTLASSTFVPRKAGISTQHVISRRDLTPRSSQATEEFALRQSAHVHNRYRSSERDNSNEKRAVGVAAIGNIGADTEYFISVQFGTPAISLNFIADTGSSDLIAASAPCISGCVKSTPLFNPNISSTSKVSNTPFQISYGSGQAKGTLASDVLSIGGLPAINQVFGAVTQSDGIFSGNIAGICGLGFKALAETGVNPILQQYAETGVLDFNLFSLALRRFVNVTNAQDIIEPGGYLTIGATNSSLYTGSINYIPITNPPSYWLIPLQSISVGGVDLKISALSTAIDSGTSLIAAPQAACDSIYSAIPGAKPITFQGQAGYYAYPCSTQVKVSFTFGGVAYPMDPVDFNSGPIDDLKADSNLCLGAFFVLEGTISGGPTWIIGDSYLKNVYTVFRFSPNPAVGFATLSTNSSFNTQAGSSGSSGGSSSKSPGSSLNTAMTLRWSIATITGVFLWSLV